MSCRLMWVVVASVVAASPVPECLAQTDAGTTADALSQDQRRLDTQREGILDPDLQLKDRRRWALLLLSYRSEQTTALIVELLGMPDRPEVQRALCDALADRSLPPGERLNDAFINPLLALLGAEPAELRALAAQILADFPGDNVPATLGALASQSNVSLAKRMAAVDALSPNTHRREVVEQLVNLLDVEAPEIIERIVAALALLVPRSFDKDANQWRAWWSENSKLSNEAWIVEQLQFQRDRRRSVEDELNRFRTAARALEQAMAARSDALQRELYRALGEEQREIRLTEWLSDPIPHVKGTAMSIIKERMGDEGKRPTGGVLTKLLTVLSDDSPRLRREALQIVQNLSDPAVVQAILAQLKLEKDIETRCAIFEALGTLDSPDAVAALALEIGALHKRSDCVRQAAVALGRIAATAKIADRFPEAVTALNTRFQDAAADDVALRTALLAAMVGAADPSFVRAFLDAVDSDDPGILREAIQGLSALGDTSKLPRLRTLTQHADARVRLEATSTIGLLGREEADLERLFPRLSPGTESNAAVREMAWRRFQEFFGRRPLPERIAAAQRLRHSPELEAKYLEALVNDLSEAGGAGAELEGVLSHLADALVRQLRYAEAAQRLQTMYDLQQSQSSSRATHTGLRLLDARLRNGGNPRVADLIRALSASGADDVRAGIVQTISAYLDGIPKNGATDKLALLLVELKTVEAEPLGTAWAALLDRLEAICAADDARTDSSPPGAEPDGP